MLSIHTCVSTLALSIRVLASAIKPLMAQPSKQRQQKVSWDLQQKDSTCMVKLGEVYFNSILCKDV